MLQGNKVVIKSYGKGVETIKGKLLSGLDYELKHINNDPENVYRFYLKNESYFLELTPSKGLSVRDFSYKGRNFFWDSPLNVLPDPRDINLEDSLIINGSEVKGTRWIEYFVSHIEMLGLDNWGMTKEINGRILCLHGNVAMIPIEQIILTEKEESVTVSGEFYIYDPNRIFPHKQNVDPYFKVQKNIELFLKKPALLIRDVITNIGRNSRFPDWGYHVQLRPEKGSRYLIPSKEVRKRWGGKLEDNYEYWKEAEEEAVRIERDYIHRNILYKDNAFPGGGRGVETLLLYSDGTGIKCTIPPSPYTMSWFSCGGKNGSEFVLPKDAEIPEKKLLEKNWDGVGPEFGASALDDDGDTDPDVMQRDLSPGESKELKIYLELLDRERASSLLKDVKEYSAG